MRIFIPKESRGQLQACMRTWPPQDSASMEELLHPPLCLCLLSAITYNQWKNCQAGSQLPLIQFSVPLGTTHPSRYGRNGIIKLFELQRILEIYVLYITQATPPPTPMRNLSHLCQRTHVQFQTEARSSFYDSPAVSLFFCSAVIFLNHSQYKYWIQM